MDWYFFALLALAFYTIQGLLLKTAAIKKCDNNLTTFYYLLTVSLISSPLLFFYGISTITILGIIAALINGFFFSISTITRIGALKYIPASIVYPVIRLNSAILVILFILLLGERITLQNSVGIVLAVIAVLLLTKGEVKK